MTLPSGRTAPLAALCGALILTLVVTPSLARAEPAPADAAAEPASTPPEPDPAPPAAPQGGLSEITPSSWTSVALFLGGAAAAFLAHEGCHTVVNYALGSHPRLEGVRFLGVIPFFAITPSVSCDGGRCLTDEGKQWGPGKAGLYAILSAGFQCQQMENELILSLDPRLRQKEAPFRKGVLVFNTLLSIGYAVASWADIEPPAGDLATADRMAPFPRGILAASIFVPAALDIVRYFFPDSAWLPWVGRASKGGLIGLAFAF